MICLAGLGSALAADTFDGVYTGRRAVEKGAGPRCEGSDLKVVIKGETLRITAGHRPSVLMSFLPRRVIQPTLVGGHQGTCCDNQGSHRGGCPRRGRFQ